MTPAERTSTVVEYFRRADAGRIDTVDLFTEHAEIYFPKFGVRTGKDALAELAIGLMTALASIAHDVSSFTFTAEGDRVVVEGLTAGTDAEGHSWSGGATPGGRFCSVFEFDGELISRMHIYTDPDYTGADDRTFHWGRDRSW